MNDDTTPQDDKATPAAWVVFTADEDFLTRSRRDAESWMADGLEVVALYRHSQPTLTDAEREAIAVACGDSSQWGRPHVATLMRLLERTK